MRMPFIEFITSGDLKFSIVFIIFTGVALFHGIKKAQLKKSAENYELINYHNSKIDSAAFWIISASILSLLLGLMHSFYFIGKAGGIAPSLIFQGVSNALITPVLGVCLFMISKIFKQVFTPKMFKS